MKTNIKLLTLMVLLLSIYSCNTETIDIDNANNDILSINDYLKAISTKGSEGKILIQSYTSVETQDGIRLSSISSSLKEDTKTNHSFELINSKSKQRIENVSNNSSLVDGLFGNTYTYSIGNNKSGGGEVYIPELISATISTDKIEVGTVVTWNIDPINENGVAIWYEYSPFKQSKYDVVDNNRKGLAGGFTLPETDGSYTFTEDDLSQLPNDANITINISRAGIDSENEQVVVGITSVSKDLYVQK